jgi:hypothetical protein
LSSSFFAFTLRAFSFVSTLADGRSVVAQTPITWLEVSRSAIGIWSAIECTP